MTSIETLMQSNIDKQAVLGAAVAILQNGEVSYLGGLGTTSVDANGIRVTPETLFSCGSIGKTICATLIVRLAEHCPASRDTPRGMLC